MTCQTRSPVVTSCVQKRNDGTEEFLESLEEALMFNSDIRAFVYRAQYSLNPLRVLSLFQRISAVDCEILDMDPRVGRPENMILSALSGMCTALLPYALHS